MPVTTSKGDGRALITGVVTFRERMAVPPEAEVRVSLEDVSLADVAAETIAETRFRAAGGPPYAFAITYDPGQIDPRRRYSLRASIRLGDQLLFTTTEAIPAFDRTSGVEIPVRRAAGRPADR